MERIGLLTH